MVKTKTGLGHTIGIGHGRTHRKAASGGGTVEESWSGGGSGGGEMAWRRQQLKN